MKDNTKATAVKLNRQSPARPVASTDLLRLPGVMAKVPMSRSWIYAGVKAGTFPKPVNVGPKAVGWLAEEIEQYIEARAASRSGAVATQKAQ